MSNYFTENNDPFFDLPSVETDETRYCSSEACDNELMPEDEDGLCQSCEAERQEQAKVYERMYRASKSGLSKEEILDAYSDPTDAAKRARMERELR